MQEFEVTRPMAGDTEIRERFRKVRQEVRGKSAGQTQRKKGTGTETNAPEDCRVGIGVRPGREMGVAWSNRERVVTGVTSFWELWTALASLNPSTAVNGDTRGLRDASSCCVVVGVVDCPAEGNLEKYGEPKAAYELGARSRDGELLRRWLEDTGYLAIEHETTPIHPDMRAAQDRMGIGEWEGPDTPQTRSALELLAEYELV